MPDKPFYAATLLLISWMSTSSAASIQNAFVECPNIPGSEERLACFDGYAKLYSTSSVPSSQAVESDLSSIGNRILSTREIEAAGYNGADISGLSGHRQNRLLFRRDETALDEAYMDADLSVKYPFLTNAVEHVFDKVNWGKEFVTPRLYFAFSTRFSQYIKTRKSSPVVPRRYNPELFLRLWRDDGDFYDIGYAHESNGQSITQEDDFLTAQEKFLKPNDGNLDESEQFIENPLFARDELSRGWDYFSFRWRKQWDANIFKNIDGRTESLLEVKRFLSDGFLQGAPEEYHTWEDGGRRERPREKYDGLNYSFQYFLPPDSCTFSVCLTKVQIQQATGYRDIFENNTTELQLTLNIGDIPFHVWGKTGYNNDLVDYYDYTNSWGIGFEFSR